MDEGDPSAPWNMDVGERTMRYDDFSHLAFTKKLHRQILPNDTEHREGFDVPTTFRLGDPNVHFHAATAKSYETSGDIGNRNGTPSPLWLHFRQNEPSSVRFVARSSV